MAAEEDTEALKRNRDSYMRCFVDMCRRMGLVGEALGCHEDADPEDILAEAKAHASFVRRVVDYVTDPTKADLLATAVNRWKETHRSGQSSGVGGGK